MSIKKRNSKKTQNGITYQVSFNYTDMLSKEKKTHTKSGFLSYEDALNYEQAKKEELSSLPPPDTMSVAGAGSLWSAGQPLPF